MKKELVRKVYNKFEKLYKEFEKLNKAYDLKRLTEEVVKYFSNTTNSDDKMFHKLAENLNVEPSVLESAAYKLLIDFFNAGKSKEGKTMNDAKVKQGTAIEMEHTTNPIIARKIAIDHLNENEKYYDLLNKAGL
jgi:hypothetical protein